MPNETGSQGQRASIALLLFCLLLFGSLQQMEQRTAKPREQPRNPHETIKPQLSLQAPKAAHAAESASKPKQNVMPAAAKALENERSAGSMTMEQEHATFNPSLFAKKYEVVEVIATGYYAGIESTGKEPGHPQYGITYSGVMVQRDQSSISTIAADLDVFPLGTLLYIPGYGYGIVADIGSAIKGRKIDLYFHTKEDVFKQWGKKKLGVYVIERGSGKITEEMMEQFSDTYKS